MGDGGRPAQGGARAELACTDEGEVTGWRRGVGASRGANPALGEDGGHEAGPGGAEGVQDLGEHLPDRGAGDRYAEGRAEGDAEPVLSSMPHRVGDAADHEHDGSNRHEFFPFLRWWSGWCEVRGVSRSGRTPAGWCMTRPARQPSRARHGWTG